MRRALRSGTVVLASLTAAAVAADPASPPVLAHVLARYPATDANATAERLVALGEELGLDLRPRPWGPTCEREPVLAEADVWREASRYLSESLEDPAAAGPLPPPVARFVSMHQGTLDAIRRLLRLEAPPAWPLDVALGVHGPHPSGGLFALRRLLLALALDALATGDPATAEGWLEAAWRVAESTRGRPDTWPWAQWNPEVKLVRRLEAPADAWRERVLRLDPREPLRDGQLLEIWAAHRVLGQGKVPVTDYLDCINRIGGEDDVIGAWLERLHRVLVRSAPARAYARTCAVEFAARLRVLLDRLVELDACELVEAAYPAEPAAAPRWNRLDALFGMHQHSVWSRAGRELLEAELTARVLEARRRRAADGSWPAAVPGIERSSCARGAWRYEALPGGGARIEFVSDVYGDGFRRRAGPLRFEER